VHKAGKTTVAFVRANVSGHTVLPVLACREIVMSKGATLGPIVGDAVLPLEEGWKNIYASTLALHNRTPMAAAIRKLYDPAVQLRWGFDRNAAGNPKLYIDAANPAEKEKVTGPGAVTGVPDGAIGRYSAAVAQEIGLCKATAETLSDLAELY